jgi:hypothetical protein
VCLIECGCACSTGTSAAGMIGRTILITAVIDGCPCASGRPSRGRRPSRGNRNGLWVG